MPAQELNLLQMWGSVQRSLGRLEQAALDSHLRQDDMRREYMVHIRRIEQRLEQRRPGWMRWIPWDKVLLMAISTLGAMGWLKPAWVRLFATLAGG